MANRATFYCIYKLHISKQFLHMFKNKATLLELGIILLNILRYIFNSSIFFKLNIVSIFHVFLPGCMWHDRVSSGIHIPQAVIAGWLWRTIRHHMLSPAEDRSCLQTSSIDCKWWQVTVLLLGINNSDFEMILPFWLQHGMYMCFFQCVIFLNKDSKPLVAYTISLHVVKHYFYRQYWKLSEKGHWNINSVLTTVLTTVCMFQWQSWSFLLIFLYTAAKYIN